jgi:hypothetical protein
MSRRPRRWRRRVIVGAAILVVLVVGGSVAGFHLIAAKAPAMLALPRSVTRSGTPAVPGPSSGQPHEQDLRLAHDVGRFGDQGLLHREYGQRHGDKSERNVLDVSAYPTATFVLTSPIELGTIPADGTVRHVPATGNLTLHGITKAVRITVTARRAGGSIHVLTDIPIAFSGWHISLPDAGGLTALSPLGRWRCCCV